MATFASAASSLSSQTRWLFTQTSPAAMRPWLRDRFDRLGGDVDDLVDLVLLDDQRRRHGDRIARLAHHQAQFEGLHERLEAARADRALDREVDAARHAEIA